MAEIIYKFDIIEDANRIVMVQMSHGMFSVLFGLQCDLRNMIKHGDPYDEKLPGARWVQQLMYGYMENNRVDLDEVE